MILLQTYLMFLMSTFGFANPSSYQPVQSKYQEFSKQISFLSKDNCDIEYYEFCSITGENRYEVVMNGDKDYWLYDKKTNEWDEKHNECNIKISDKYLNIYNPNAVFEYESFLYFNGEGIFYYYDNNEADISYIRNRDTEVPGGYYTFTDYGSDVTKISNSFFFEKLGNRHSTNSSGTCAIVAIEILLNYYDSFLNDCMIEESFEFPANYFSNTIEDFPFSPGIDCDESNFFQDTLIEFAIDHEIHGTGIGMNGSEEYSLVNTYLQDRNYSFSLNYNTGSYLENISEDAFNIITNAIDNNRPAFVGSYGHATVAYAYDSNYVYVHTGWGHVAKTPLSTVIVHDLIPETYPHSIDISSLPHVHSDNYYNSGENKWVCPCGAHTSLFQTSAEDYDFSESYPNVLNYKNVYINNSLVSTTRLRAGYIQQESINLSPRKANCGTAYLDIEIQFKIHRVFASLSLWSEYEYLNSNDSSIYFRYYNSSYNWVNSFDILNSNLLGTNRYNKTEFTFDVDPDVNKVSFYSTAPAVGDRNKGRLAIGYINYEVWTY